MDPQLKFIPLFEDLNTSTMTVMVYSNIIFDLPNIFSNVKITSPIKAPLTKKKKNIDKKNLEAAEGTIISAQHGNKHRGISTKKTKKHWCSVNCRLTKVNVEDETEIKILSIVERFVLIEGTDIYETQYYCSNCDKTFILTQLKKIVNFLNQVTIVMSIGDLILNIMIFKDNFKIAGCKSMDHAIKAVKLLWDVNIKNLKDGYTLKKNHLGNEHPSFLFRLVMKNVDFKLGFFIDREELNKLMNKKEYSHIVYMSQCETTGHTNVNIRIFCERPEDYNYDCLIIPSDKDAYFVKVKDNPYKIEKKKKDKITFIVFSSSEIILSGRYDSEMKRAYDFFIKTVFDHRNIIEEKIKKPQEDLLSILKS